MFYIVRYITLMADNLRDRYRRDYKSIPIPTPPRVLPSRRPIDTIQSNPVIGVKSPAVMPVPALTDNARKESPKPQKPLEPPSVPIQTQAQITQKSPSKRRKRRLGRKLLLVPLLFIVLSGLGYGSWLGYQHYKPLPLPRQYLNLGFPIYYPKTLPAGYYVDKQTLDNSSNTLLFTIKNSSDNVKTVTVSEQITPAGFNPDKQLPDDPAGPSNEDRKFTTAAGKIEITYFQSNLVASLGTAKTWVIMNISTVPSADADAIARSFQKL